MSCTLKVKKFLKFIQKLEVEKKSRIAEILISDFLWGLTKTKHQWAVYMYERTPKTTPNISKF
jgi:hypothetical protein